MEFGNSHREYSQKLGGQRPWKARCLTEPITMGQSERPPASNRRQIKYTLAVNSSPVATSKAQRGRRGGAKAENVRRLMTGRGAPMARRNPNSPSSPTGTASSRVELGRSATIQ